jgi:hypothetical protein
MTHHIKLSIKQQIQSFKNAILQLPELPFSEILSEHSLQQIIEDSPRKRHRIFTPLVTLKAFIAQVLSADRSCRQAVSQVLAERISQGKKANSINTSSYCKARDDLPLKTLIQTAKETGKTLHSQAHPGWLWKGHNTLIVDGTTMLMPDTESNQQAFPQQTCQKPGLGFPITRIVGLISLSTGSIVSYAQGAYQGKGTGETSLFSRLFCDIATNDLLLADRYYCTWAIITLLLKQDSHILVQNHAQRKEDFSIGEKLGAKDHIIFWKKPKRKPAWISDIDYLALPDEVRIREFSVGGIVYVTTLLDSKKYPKKELAKLYKKRWKIELDFRHIKTNLGMEMLRCKSADRVRKEIAVYFLSYNLIRASIARSSVMNKKTPRQFSFMTAVQLYNEIKIQLTFRAGKILQHIAKSSLDAMTMIGIGKQKRKKQPRAVKRRPKAYPLLKTPRKEACELLNQGVIA